jgi:hypothetical protein
MANQTDKNYTGGLNITFKPKDTSFYFKTGYKLFTPENKESTSQPLGEHPYAAYRFLGLGHRSKFNTFLINDLSVSYIQAGPQVKGKLIQDIIHRHIGAKLAKGWSNQISNASGIQYEYKGYYKRPFFEWGNFASFYPYVGLKKGDFFSAYSVGGKLRFSPIFTAPKLQVNEKKMNGFFLYAELNYEYFNVDKNRILNSKNPEDYKVGVKNHFYQYGLDLITGYDNLEFDFYIRAASKQFDTQTVDRGDITNFINTNLSGNIANDAYAGVALTWKF